MPYGGLSYSQSPQLDSPLQHSGGALVTQHMGSSSANVYTAGSDSNGSPSAVSTTALQTTSQAAATALTTSLFRNDDKRLTREAMEKYLRNRNDMIIVILHAKVITH